MCSRKVKERYGRFRKILEGASGKPWKAHGKSWKTLENAGRIWIYNRGYTMESSGRKTQVYKDLRGPLDRHPIHPSLHLSTSEFLPCLYTCPCFSFLEYLESLDYLRPPTLTR
jgi:hypothetical protein